jgi:hypothetical protein
MVLAIYYHKVVNTCNRSWCAASEVIGQHHGQVDVHSGSNSLRVKKKYRSWSSSNVLTSILLPATVTSTNSSQSLIMIWSLS